MMTRRLRLALVGIAFGLSATGFWFGWRNGGEADESRKLTRTLEEQSATTRAAIVRSQSTLATAIKTRDDIQLRLQQTTKPTTPTEQKNPAATSDTAKTKSPLERLRTDPELQRLKLAADRARLSSTYGAFFRESSMSDAEIECFKDLMIKRDADMLDLAALRSDRTSAEDKAVEARLREKTFAEYISAMRELLGSQRYQQFESFEHLAPAREIVSGMASVAVAAGKPFTAQQADQLVQALAEADMLRKPNGFVSVRTIDWGSAFARAEGFLSPTQLDMIKTVEPRGPRGAGSRFLIELHKAIDAAEQAELETVKK